MKSDIFEDNMTLLNTELMKSNRQLVSTDTFVFIINSKDLEKLKQLSIRLNWSKLTTY